MTTIINMIGFSKSQDNKSIPKIMLMPNLLSLEFKVKQMKPQNKENKRNLLKREKRTEPILDSKL